MKIAEHKNIKFYYRENTSDLKTFEEVIVRDAYQKKETKFYLAKNGLMLAAMSEHLRC